MSTNNPSIHLAAKDGTIIEPVRAKGGGGTLPPMDNLGERVAKLETSTSEIRTDVAVIKSNYATKADIATLEGRVIGVETKISEAINAMTYRFLGIVLLLLIGGGLIRWVIR